MYSESVERQCEDVRAALAHALLLAGRRWRARLNERLKTIGQTDARCAALAEIAGNSEGIVQRELSQRLGVEEPTIVRLIDALEANAFVERRVHSGDRRAKVVQATAQAVPVLDQARGIVAELQDEMFAQIDPAELAICLRVIDQLSHRLDRN